MMKKKYLATGLMSIALTLSACMSSHYKIDVNQGNIISKKDLGQLSLGMSKDEVQMILGRSLLQDMFHRNRWDYVQYYKNGRTQKVQEGVVSLFFTNGQLRRINGDKVTTITEEPLSYGTLAKEQAIEIDKVIFKEQILGINR